MKTKPNNKKPNLEKLVKEMRKAGVRVTCSLEDINLPTRIPGDPREVTALLDESVRLAKLANSWERCEHPNPVAAQAAYTNAWAYALAGAWLRCFLKGEFRQPNKE